MSHSYSFATLRGSCAKLELIKSPIATGEAAVRFKVVRTSLSANNKFYLGFGDRAPFHFFRAYPVPDGSEVARDGAPCDDGTHVRPPAWGLCEVAESNVEGARVGDVFRAMLPLGTEARFEGAEVEPKLGNLVVRRPGTHPAYNAFAPIPAGSVCHPNHEQHSGLALACYPGIVTGFGLFFALKRADHYSCDTIVVTSASSKVALALAIYMKEASGKRLVGYTSDSNREFCLSTNLYDDVLGYEEALPDTIVGEVVMVDISGRGDVYAANRGRVRKLLCIGNSSGTPDGESSFAQFGALAKAKMVLTMMGGPKWIRTWMNPVQELFLIMDVTQELIDEWGKDEYLETVERYTERFCEKADQWVKARACETEESIASAFEDIVGGKVPPSECIVLDVAEAVSHR